MIQEYKDFLTKEQCQEIINLVSSRFEAAGTLGKKIDGYRVAESTWIFNNDQPLIKVFRERVSQLSGLPVCNMENISVVKYEIGGEYKYHQDFFHPGESYYDSCMQRGGQRLKTALLYLNEEFTGGETEFRDIPLTVKPETGKLIIWENVSPDGTLNFKSSHAGLPVITGTKYIATIWIRESEFK